MKKIGKTTRPLRYDRNQIPYNYIVDMTDRYKELDLVDRVPEKLWMEVLTLYKTIPKKKKCKKAKCLSEEPYKRMRKKEKQNTKEKRKDIPTECRVPMISKER